MMCWKILGAFWLIHSQKISFSSKKGQTSALDHEQSMEAIFTMFLCGLDPSTMSRFYLLFDSPKTTHFRKLFIRHQKTIAQEIIYVTEKEMFGVMQLEVTATKESMSKSKSEVQYKNKHNTPIFTLTPSYDMGWNKRSSWNRHGNKTFKDYNPVW